MSPRTPVSAVMTRSVRTLDVNAKFSEVRRALVANEFHHMPIVDGDALVGILSWRDLVRAYRTARRGAATGDPFALDDLLDRTTSIEQVMSKDLVTLREDEPLERAIDLIADGHIHSVLVLDDDDKLVGIVTDKDIIAYLAG